MYQKNRLVNSNLKAVILYDSETWRIAISTTNKIHTFINKYQKHILQIKWPGKMRNADSSQGTNLAPAEGEIMKRWWQWTGNSLGKITHNTW